MGLCSDQLGLCLTNTSWVNSVQIASSFAFSSRTATTAYSRAHGTLLTIEDVHQGIPQTVSPVDILFVLNALFSTGPLTPAEAAVQGITVVGDFVDWVWSYANQYVMYGSLYGAEDFFRSMVTIPLLWSQVNGPFNSTFATKIPGPYSGFPSDLYTTGQLARSENRIVIAKWTVIVYTILGSWMYLWCIMFLFWTMRIQGPRMSPWPLIDFGARLASGAVTEQSPSQSFAGVALAKQFEIRKQLEDRRVFLRVLPKGGGDSQDEANAGGETIGLTTLKELKTLRLWNAGTEAPLIHHDENIGK